VSKFPTDSKKRGRRGFQNPTPLSYFFITMDNDEDDANPDDFIDNNYNEFICKEN
jgi:hypothetical protein